MYLEPVCPLFWGLSPFKNRSFWPPKQGSFSCIPRVHVDDVALAEILTGPLEEPQRIHDFKVALILRSPEHWDHKHQFLWWWLEVRTKHMFRQHEFIEYILQQLLYIIKKYRICIIMYMSVQYCGKSLLYVVQNIWMEMQWHRIPRSFS